MKRSWRRKKKRKLSSLCVKLKKSLMSKMFGRKILLFLLWRLLHRFKVKVRTKQCGKLSSSLFQVHRERVRENRMGAGKDGEVEPACKRCFQYLISVCQLLVFRMIGQFLLLTSTLTSIASCFANAESNKHEECVKPSHTAHFDI